VQRSTDFDDMDERVEMEARGRISDPERPRMSRRAFALGGLLGVFGAAAVSGVEAYQARYVNPYEPRLERVSIPAPPGHEALAGLRIGFITDTHVGPFVSPDDLARATALLADERPDLILLGGDYVSESPRYVGSAVEGLGDLVNETPLGGYAVLGNHDMNVSATKVTAGLEAVHITVLRNQSAPVAFGGDTLWVAGIDETLLGHPDPRATFAQVPNGAAALALWHEPQFAEQAAAQGAFLQLSGHTHGGQIRIPGVGPVGLPVHGKRYVMGLNDAAGMAIYTARGVGVYRPPMRFNCPPEVTVISLTKPDQ
jgi:predicted MPP superfamily phosphohydrolase